MKPAFDVIVCGSLHLDIVVHARALPRIDETAVGSAWKQVCGGKGGNQAVQAARAGAQTAMIGRIGDDAFGKTLHANLLNEGVDVSGLSVDPSVGSGMSVAILQDDGDYGAVIVSGSNLSIDPKMLQEQWTALGGGKILILQNEVPDAVNLGHGQGGACSRCAGGHQCSTCAGTVARSAELNRCADRQSRGSGSHEWQSRDQQGNCTCSA